MKKLNITSGILAAAASVAGIFFDIYKDIPWVVYQMKGQDVVTIIASAVLIISVLRADKKSLTITAGINAYLVYTYFLYAISSRLNPLFHIYLAVVFTSLLSLIIAIGRLKCVSDASAGKKARAFSVIYLCVIAAGLAFLWNADIIASLSGSPILDTPTGEPLTIVYVFDLTFVIPAIIYTLYLLKTDNKFGIPLCCVVLAKCVTMGAALLGMTVGVWAGGLELETFLAVFWFILAVAGTAALIIFLKGSRIVE